MLLLDANEPVSRDRLIEGLWGDDAAAERGRSRSTATSRGCGASLGADRVVRRPPGYLLRGRAGRARPRALRALVERREPARTRRAASCAARSRCGAGRRSPTCCYEPFARERGRAARGAAAASRSRSASTPTSRRRGRGARARARSARRASTRSASAWSASSCSRSTAPAARPTRSPRCSEARQRLADELGLAPGPAAARARAADPRSTTRALDRAGRPRGRRRDAARRRRASRSPSRGAARRRGAGAAALLAVRGGGTTARRARGRTTARSRSTPLERRARSRAVELPGAAGGRGRRGGIAVARGPGRRPVVLRLDPATGHVDDRIASPGQPGGARRRRRRGLGREHARRARSRASTRPPAGDADACALGGADAVGAIAARRRGGSGSPTRPSRALVAARRALGRRPRAPPRSTCARPRSRSAPATSGSPPTTRARSPQIDPASGRTLRTVRVGSGPSALVARGRRAVGRQRARRDRLADRPASGRRHRHGPRRQRPGGARRRRRRAVGRRASTRARSRASTRARTASRARSGVGGEPRRARGRGRPRVGRRPGRRRRRTAAARCAWSRPQPLHDDRPRARSTRRAAAVRRTSPTTRSSPSRSRRRRPACGSSPTSPSRCRGPRDGGTDVHVPAAARDPLLRRPPAARARLPPRDRAPVPGRLVRRGLLRGHRGRGALPRAAGATARLTDGIAHRRRAPAPSRSGCAAPDPDFLFKLTRLRLRGADPARRARPRRRPHAGPRHRALPGRELRPARERPLRAQPALPRVVARRAAGRQPRRRSSGASPTLRRRPRGGRARATPTGCSGSLPPRAAAARCGSSSPAQLHENRRSSFDFIPLNTHAPPFDDVRVRRALNFAIDRGRIARMYGGPASATPLCQALLPGLLGHRPYCPYRARPARRRARARRGVGHARAADRRVGR